MATAGIGCADDGCTGDRPDNDFDDLPMWVACNPTRPMDARTYT